MFYLCATSGRVFTDLRPLVAPHNENPSMTDLTIDQALQKGIEAHKAGQVQDADRHYTAILKAQPKHPDANHNLGVLAVGIGKVEQALPFFKTAVEANPATAQFWLSYIDALIKLDQLTDAKAVLDQAKGKGAKGDGFNKLEQRLKEVGQEPLKLNQMASAPQSEHPNILDTLKLDQAKNKGAKDEDFNQVEKRLKEAQGESLEDHNAVRDGKQQKPNILDTLKLEQALKLAKRKAKKGASEETRRIYQDILTKFPKNKRAIDGLKGLTFGTVGRITQARQPPQNQVQALINLLNQGRLQEATEQIHSLMQQFPSSSILHNIRGAAFKQLGRLDASIEAYQQALTIDPNNAEAYNNMGLTLKSQGRLEEAIKFFNKALAINPNFDKAYNNIGLTLLDQGKLEEAIKCYKKAISINTDFSDAFWNLSGTAENICESQKWLKLCLEIDPSHFKAKLTLSALQFYEGDQTNFDILRHSPLKNHPLMRSFTWAFELPNLPELYFHRWALFDRMIEHSKRDRPFYEYGVWRGEAFQYLIKTFKRGYGFDTFQGIPEDWHGEKAGAYSSEGNIPQIEGGEFIVGKFEDTLPGFFSKPRPNASIINFDADLYSSTICALNFSKPIIDKHTILIFDEFITNKNWEQDEYKALNEFCFNNNFTYEVLAISFFTKQVAVRLLGI